MGDSPPAEAAGFALHRGQRIGYLVRGEGAPVLLAHGAFGNARDFLDGAFGRALAATHRVVAADSLGHGRSDSPADPGLYGLAQRAGDLVAVLDALEIGRAHVVGYSMGGWMASGVALRHPERLASLCIGGWDVVRGMYTAAPALGLAEVTYETLAPLVRAQRPSLTDWITAETEPGLRAAVDGMNDLEGAAEAVAALTVPVMFWLGEADLYRRAVETFTAARGFPLRLVPGDHESALYDHGAAAGRIVSRFIDAAAGLA